MTQINLTSDQTKQFIAAVDEVVIADAEGNILVKLPPKIGDEEADVIAEAQRRLVAEPTGRPLSEIRPRFDIKAT